MQSGNWQYTQAYSTQTLGSEQWYNFLMAHVPSPYNWKRKDHSVTSTCKHRWAASDEWNFIRLFIITK